MNVNIQHSFSEAFGGCLLAFLFFMLLLCGLSFIVNQPIGSVTAPLAFLLATGFTYIFLARGKTFLRTLISAVATIACSALICSLIYDSSYDSYGYHNDTIIMLMNGWNPLYEGPWNSSPWARHYAKGLEMMQSVILAFTGNLQSTKCVNFIFAAIAASLTWQTIGEVFPSVTRQWKTMIVILALANPVLICQMTTSYNDYMLWLETVVLTASLLQIWTDSRKVTPYLLLIMILAIGINSKFTHFYYLSMECLIFAIWCVCAKRYSTILPGVIAVFTAVIIGVFLIGHNPYVTNTVYYGNPAYPLVGGDEDIMTHNTPAIFEGGNRFINFFKSLLSVGSAEWGLFRGGFTVQEFLKTYTTDTRVNGFGVMMALMLTLGIILMLNNRASRHWWIVWLSFLAIGFSFEQSWWARYIPFIWALVIIPILNYAAERNTVREHRRKADRLIASAIFLLALTNASLAIAASFAARYSYTAYINYITETQKQVGKPIKIVNISYTFRKIFDEKDVAYEECSTEMLTTDTDNLFMIYELDVANIVAELPEKDYPKLYAEPENILDRLADFSKRRYKKIMNKSSL